MEIVTENNDVVMELQKHAPVTGKAQAPITDSQVSCLYHVR